MFRFTQSLLISFCGILLLATVFLGTLSAKGYDYNEYLYLNETTTGGAIHKFLVNPDGSLTEIGSPWFDSTIEMEGVTNPHGLGVDLNGYQYIGENGVVGQEIRKFDCEGNIFSEAQWSFTTGGQTNTVSYKNSIYYNSRDDGSLGDFVEVDACSGLQVGRVDFCDPSFGGSTVGAGGFDWGFYKDPRTNVMYPTAQQGGSAPRSLFVFGPADFNTDNYIVAGVNGQYSGGVINVGGTDYELTTTDTATGANADSVDNDGAIASGIDPDFDGEPYVLITTGDEGSVDHTYDFGFVESDDIENPMVAAFAIQPSCTDGIAGNDGYLQLSSVTGGDRYHWSTGSTFDNNGGADTYANATDLTGATYPLQFNAALGNADVGDFTIRVYNGEDGCFTDVVVTLNMQDCMTGCDCTEMIYLNEPTTEGAVHKFSVATDGTLTEIGSPWFDNAVAMEGVTSPHGVAVDLNGFVYIGESNASGEIRKFTCDGEIFPESEFAISNGGQTNIAAIDNILYTNKASGFNFDFINAYDICTGDLIGTMEYCEDASSDWGFFIDPRTNEMYATTDAATAGTSRLYYFSQSDFDLDPTTCVSDVTVGEPLPQGAWGVFGVTTDIDRNVYVIIKHTGDDRTYIRKYGPAPNFQFIGQSAVDSGQDGAVYPNGGYGYGDAIGIIYSETANRIYVSTTSPIEDCVALFDTDLNYLGSAVPPVPGADTAKGIGIVKQCCPINNNITIDTVFCENSVGNLLFLQELIACDGVICEGLWQEGLSNNGLTYNSCNNSITVDASYACGTFTLESDGTGNNPQCGAFKITVNIESISTEEPVVTGDQTICLGDPTTELTATGDADNYQWQMSTTSCTDGFVDIAGATASSYDPGSPIVTTYYRVVASNDGMCSDGTCETISDCVEITVELCCQDIGGEVFIDENNNGCQDADETTGVEGATATIYACDPITGDPVGNAVGTVMTAADGSWTFGGMSGPDACALDSDLTYTVVFDLPNTPGEVTGDPYVGYNFSTNEADGTCSDGDADDIDPGTGTTTDCYDPNDNDATDGDDDNDIDAGISPCETMGGEVFVDINNNGCQDASEMMMVEGADVTIWTCDPITGDPVMAIGTATTGPDGSWSFGGADPLTGECLLDSDQTYTVSFDMPTGPGEAFEGYGLTEGVADAACASGESDDVDPATGIANDCFNPDDTDGADGDDDENIDAGITPACEEIGGEVFVDINNNGCQDASETMMVEGVEVNIWVCDPVTDNPSAVIGTASTGADGQWSFGGMDPATGICALDPTMTYTVSFDIPNAAGDLPGDPYLGYEFTEGTADGTCAGGEADDVDPTTGTGETCYDPSDDDPEDGDDDNHIDAAITPTCQSIGGEVFVDENNNGCQDADETTGVEGAEVTIWSCDPVTGDPDNAVGIVTTGADGSWTFGGMDPATGICFLDSDATYTASFDIPNGTGEAYEGHELSTGEDDGSCVDGQTDDVDPESGYSNDCYDPSDTDPVDGDDDEDIDAGIYPCETIAGVIFYDLNNNGCQDAGEILVTEDVTVNLYACDAAGNPGAMPVGTTTTIDGAYEFGLESPNSNAAICLDPMVEYLVEFVIPNAPGGALEDWNLSTNEDAACQGTDTADDVDSSNGQSSCYNPSGDDDDMDIDAGIYPCETLGGVVFYDDNNNGCQDATENVVLEDVTVNIYECDAAGTPGTMPVGTTTTINGAYEFGPESENENADLCLDPAVTYAIEFVLPNGAGESLENYVFTSEESDMSCPSGQSDDVASDTGLSNSCYNPSGDDDDMDIDAGIGYFDLALFKILSTPTPYSFGDYLTFSITVINQGTINAANVEITDHIPSGYSYDPALNPNWIGTAPDVTQIIPFLAAGQETTIEIVLTLETSATIDWVNYAEISAAIDGQGNSVTDIDSDPDSDSPYENDVEPDDLFDDNVDGGGADVGEDEDDHDPAAPEIFDLALIKQVSSTTPGPYSYGDRVTYDITVVNQGNVVATDIEVIDYVPCGFDFDMMNFPQWVWDSADMEALTIIDGPLVPGQQTVVQITLIVQACTDVDAFLNYSEIVEASDDEGEVTEDVDSTPDSDIINDTGGVVDSPSDNQTDGNGTDDEDDHDPELIEVFDLALNKVISTLPMGGYGDYVIYDITVVNQGNVDATNVEITDYNPVGLVFDPAHPVNVANGWMGGPVNPTTVIAGPILPGETVVVQVAMIFTQTTGGDADWINYAEIVEAFDGDGNPADDADSTPDNDDTNDNPVLPGDPDDNNLDGGGPNVGEDEDDHDPANVPFVVDVALAKTTDAEAPFVVGDIVTFDLEVFNQGNVVVQNVEVIDYIPCGYEFVSSNFPLWTVAPDGSSASVTLPGPIAPGDSEIVSIDLEILYCDDYADAWTNFAEIYYFEGDDGNEITDEDIDSDGDTDPDNDIGGTPDSPEDDHVDDDGMDTDGDGIVDEDDHDPEIIEIYDLVLTKELNTPGPYAYGDLLEFEITVYNQGNQEAYDVEVTDYIPVGYSYDPAVNPTWSGAFPSPTTVIPGPIAPAGSSSVLIYLTIEQSTGGETDWFNYSEITQAFNEDGEDVTDFDWDSEAGSNGAGENDVEPGDAEDNDIDSHDLGGEEDDHDPAGIEIYDLAQFKTTSQTGPFVYGDIITYDITVYNQGSIASSGITITDYLPCGLGYLPVNDAEGWSYDGTNATNVLPGILVPGADTTFSIQAVVQQCLDSDVASFTNYTEISDSMSEDPDEPADDIDSSEDTDVSNDTGGIPESDTDDTVGNENGDEDDHDPEIISVFDLAQIKELVTPGPYAYGDLLEFSFTVCNQGNVDAQSIEVTDYIPVGYSFDAATNPDWTLVGTDAVYSVPGILLQDECTSFSIFLTIEQSQGGEKDWINYSEITNADDDADPNNTPPTDADSVPGSDGAGENAVEPNEAGDDDLTSTDLGGEEDDHDPAGIEIYDLAQIKTTVEPGPYTYGDVITHQVTVYNQGSIASSGITIADYLPCGFEYNTANDANGWSLNGSVATIVIPGVLAPGESVTVDILVTVQQCLPGGDEIFTNVTEITDSSSEDPDEPADDIDSEEDGDPTNDPGGVPNSDTDNTVDNENGDEDDQDPELIKVYDLALTKVATWMGIDSVGPFVPGDVVEYHIDVFNQGNQTVYNTLITDYVRNGYIFDPALNPGWSVAASGDLEFTIAGPFTPATTENLILNLIVDVPADATAGSWYNEAEVSEMMDEDGVPQIDADSTPDNDPDNDNDLVDGDDADNIFNGDLNDNVIDNSDGDEDDNDAAEILVTSELGDTVWKDVDGNGIQDPGEVGVEGVKVIITRCDGEPMDPWVTDTLYTDANGMYIFDQLLPSIINGGYMVEFDISELPVGCAFTLQDVGDDAADSDVDIDGLSECVFLDPGENNYTIDAGLLILAKVGNYVWEDCNGNGIQDAGELPLESIRVELYDTNDDLIQFTYTDVNGEYVFDFVYPGDYYIKFIAPSGDVPTTSGSGTDNTLDSDINGSNGEGTTSFITLSSGECDFDSGNAGFYECVPLGETVWYDANGNDVQDPTENGLNGIKVEVYTDNDGVWELYDYQFTGHKPGSASDDGYWKMCVPPGRYYVRYIAPPIGLALVNSNVGGNSLLDSDVTEVNGPGTTNAFTLSCNDERCDVGAGFEPMSTLGDKVWNDSNGNGLIDANEPGIDGVEVLVYNEDNEFVDQTITDVNGNYHVEYLQEREYYLQFIPPSGFVPTIGNMGDDSVDSDIDFSNGLNTTSRFRTVSGEHMANIDAGFVQGVILSNLYLGVSAERIDDANQIDWTVASDAEVDYYTVQVKGDTGFEDIGQQMAENVTNQYTYHMIDNNATASGTYLYRVAAVMSSGDVNYSDIVSIVVDGQEENDVKVYPNPASESITVAISNEIQNARATLTLRDFNGKVIINELLLSPSLKIGEHIFPMNIDQVPGGVYSIDVTLNSYTTSKKIVVID